MAHQDYGQDPSAACDTNQYQIEQIHSFADQCDQTIDWDRCADSECDFSIRILKEHGARKVLDVATGTEFHSVCLLKAVLEVGDFQETYRESEPDFFIHAAEKHYVERGAGR
jgi:glycine/sarcosine N-methyltransferase